MVSALDRKLFRDLIKMRAQLLAIVLVVACGVASYVSMLSVYSSLTQSGQQYFDESEFPHVFARMGRTPEPVAHRLEAIPSVAFVQTRIVRDVTLDVPGMAEPAVGRLISIPDDHQPRLSRLHLRLGRWVAPGRDDEVIISEAFANVHGLQPGDELTAVVAGRRQSFEIVGIALSPEYIFSMSSGVPWPDDKRFGVLWLSREAMGAAFDMDGAFDDVVMTLEPGANEASVLHSVDRVIERYGGRGSHGRGQATVVPVRARGAQATRDVRGDDADDLLGRGGVFAQRCDVAADRRSARADRGSQSPGLRQSVGRGCTTSSWSPSWRWLARLLGPRWAASWARGWWACTTSSFGSRP